MSRPVRALLILASVALSLLALINLSAILSFFSSLLSLLFPPLVGLSLAFILNIPLSLLERSYLRLFGKGHPRLRRFLCLVLCFLFLFGAVALILYTILPQLSRTVGTLISRLPDYVETVRAWYLSLGTFLSEHRIPLSLPAFPADTSALSASLGAYLEEHRTHLLRLSGELLRSTYRAMLNLLLGIVFSLYFLFQKETLCAQGRKLLFALFSRSTAHRILAFAALCRGTFSRFLTGQLLEASLLGSICFLGMLLFDMPYPLLISLIIGVTALVPVFGAIVGTALGALLILLDSPTTALWFVLFILTLQQVETNLIYPRVVGKSVGLPGVWVLLSVTVGGSFGIGGLLLSVPTAAVLYCSLSRFVNRRLRKKEEFVSSEDS